MITAHLEHQAGDDKACKTTKTNVSQIKLYWGHAQDEQTLVITYAPEDGTLLLSVSNGKRLAFVPDSGNDVLLGVIER